MQETAKWIYPELFVLVPVLYALGKLFKSSSLQDRLIPFLLEGAGCGLCFLYLAGQGISQSGGWLQTLFATLTQGTLCASCSVYAKNLVKQWQERGKEDGT